MKTFIAKNETVQRDWYIVDAEGKTLGRLASELARRLRGTHNARRNSMISGIGQRNQPDKVTIAPP
jgi:ribosomal protein L13